MTYEDNEHTTNAAIRKAITAAIAKATQEVTA